MKKKNHYYSFVIILGNEDSHIVPHPAKKWIKKFIIPRLKEIIEQLKEDL